VPRRIVIKGSCGAGKSIIAPELAGRLKVTYIELDALHHGPNWSEPTPEEFQTKVRLALEGASDGWIVDGNYDSKLGDLVVAQADTIVWLDLPLSVKWRRVWRRTIDRLRNQVELWNGNRETWRDQFASRDSIFIQVVRTHVRHKRRWPKRFAGDARLVRLRTEDEVLRWLETTPEE
jgi:adenylate kinase family enzyme